MDNRLQVLINYHEEEHQTIVQSIEECLQEKDYLKAHHLSITLNDIKRKLKIFRNLEDRLYDEKEFLKGLIKRQENWVKPEIAGFMIGSFAERLAKSKADLEQLNQQNQESNTNQFVFDQTLEKLITKQIKSFILIINKQKDFYFKFRIIKNNFSVTIPNINKLLKAYNYFTFQIKKYERLGFQLENNGNKMVVTLPCKTEEDANHLKIILSRIIFEILDYGSDKSETYIVYKQTK